MPALSDVLPLDHPVARVLLVILAAVIAQVAVRTVQRLGQRARRVSLRTGLYKLLTITSLVTSFLTLAIWFTAVGLVLTEAGLDLRTYFASATIIGLAVGFGSQGIVQDVVTGLTLVFSDLIDIGDLVEVSGQTGVVSDVGMRFVRLTNYFGATVAVPNRTINNVVTYPSGYVRALVDVRLGEDEAVATALEARATAIAMGAYEQFPGLCLAPPAVMGRARTEAGTRYFRIKLRVWPGQAPPLDALKAELAESLKVVDPTFGTWRVTITMETEKKNVTVVRPR